MAAYGSGSPETELTRLMKNYETDVVRLCFLYLRDLSLAEDAAQETFLKVYRSIGMFRRESSEKTWLMRIAINTCKDIRRGAWFRHVDRSVSLDHLPSPSVPANYNMGIIRTRNAHARRSQRLLCRLEYYRQRGSD